MPRRVWEMSGFGGDRRSNGPARGKSFGTADPIGREGISRNFLEAMKEAGVYGEVLEWAEAHVAEDKATSTSD